MESDIGIRTAVPLDWLLVPDHCGISRTLQEEDIKGLYFIFISLSYHVVSGFGLESLNGL